MKFIIITIIAIALAALAGWLVQRDSHKKSLTILTVAVIVVFSGAIMGAVNYASQHPAGILNDFINDGAGETTEHDLEGITLTLDSSWTVSPFDDLTAIEKLYQNFSRAEDEDLVGEWLILSPDVDPAALYCYDNEAAPVTVDDLREALESNEDMTVKDIEIKGLPAVEGTAQNPENENNIDYKQICFIVNDKCYELVVYHDKNATAEKIAQKILGGLERRGCGQNPGLPWALKGVEKYVFTGRGQCSLKNVSSMWFSN